MTYATKRDAETGEKTNITYDANTLRNMMLEDLKGDYLTSATAHQLTQVTNFCISIIIQCFDCFCGTFIAFKCVICNNLKIEAVKNNLKDLY